MLTPQPPNVVDRFEPVWTLFCPSSRAVIDWLDQLMPAATPPHTLELTLSGNDRQHTYRLPCVTFDRLPYLTEPKHRLKTVHDIWRLRREHLAPWRALTIS